MTGGERLARAVLLFHRGGQWTGEYAAEWEALTGSSEATTVTLCNLAREVLADEQAPQAAMTEGKEIYLGDGLYAAFDGWQIILRAPRTDGDHWVGLEPQVLASLIEWVADLNDTAVREALLIAARRHLRHPTGQDDQEAS